MLCLRVIQVQVVQMHNRQLHIHQLISNHHEVQMLLTIPYLDLNPNVVGMLSQTIMTHGLFSRSCVMD